MANMRYFKGDVQLAGVFYGGPRGMTPIGYLSDELAAWKAGGPRATEVQADRKIEYKSSPSRHVCDARCVNATGRVMKCECACGGKNHGRGTLSSFSFGEAA